MTWLKKLRDSILPDDPPGVSEETKSIYNSARAALEEAQARQVEVRHVARVAYGLRERNHFGESFERAMARKEKTL
jgi:hypothetical protein